MREEVMLAIVMLGIVAAGSLLTKNNRKHSVTILLVAAVAGSLAAGMGVRVREMVEGPFAFIDSSMTIFSASIFVFAMSAAGLWDRMLGAILRKKTGTGKSFAIMFYIALPAMLTGLASISLMTTGKKVADQMKKQGVSDEKIAGIVGVASFLGMVLPPNCMPVMLAVNGAGSVLPTPYTGFFFPLLLIALPSMVVFALLRRGDVGNLYSEEIKLTEKGYALWIPVCVLAVLLLFEFVLPSIFNLGGQTIPFTIAAIIACLLSLKKIGGLKGVGHVFSDGMMQAVVPVAVMMAIGSFTEITSMVGIRGYYSVLILPTEKSGYVPAMLIVTLLAVALGIVFGTVLPGFLATYAVFPIQWIGNVVALAGMGAAYGLTYLLAVRGGLCDRIREELGLESCSWQKLLSFAAIPAALLLVLSVGCLLFADSLTWLVV